MENIFLSNTVARSIFINAFNYIKEVKKKVKTVMEKEIFQIQ